ncbi:MAG TPA: type II secretion system protein [Chthoniobacteraceae bacterium]|nr:type II secretion system protein [Chthoniobacteraceae bacterium]
MKNGNVFKKGFTLLELLVVITIIAILAGIALPVFSQVRMKGDQTKALSNAKQIGMALKLYASDNSGNYPSYTLSNGEPTTTTVTDSNTALAQLFPTYIQDNSIFWVAKSAFCAVAPEPGTTDEPLPAGSNAWAYVISLNDMTTPEFPLLAVGFSDPSAHTYTKDQTAQGGLWNGGSSVVIRADSSGAVMTVNQLNMSVDGPRGNAGPGDIFASTDKWLGAGNVVVNPLTSTGDVASSSGGGGGGSGADGGATDSTASGETFASGATMNMSTQNTGATGASGAELMVGASSYTGQTNISAGGLVVNSAGSANFGSTNSSSDTINVSGGSLNMNAGSIQLSSGGAGSIQTFSGAGPSGGTLNLSSGGSLNLSAGTISAGSGFGGFGGVTVSVGP